MYFSRNNTNMKTYILNLIANLLVVCTAFFTPMNTFLLAIGIAVALDAIIAIATVIKTEGHHKVQSRRMNDTAIKTIVYFGAMCLARSLEILYDVDWLVRILGGYLILIQMKSVDEKWEKLFGNSIFKVVINSFPNMKREQDKEDNNAKGNSR